MYQLRNHNIHVTSPEMRAKALGDTGDVIAIAPRLEIRMLSQQGLAALVQWLDGHALDSAEEWHVYADRFEVKRRWLAVPDCVMCTTVKDVRSVLGY